MDFMKDQLMPQVTYKASRSGGKGGQHVNKVSSKAELNFDFQASDLFTEEEKNRIAEKLMNRMTASKQIQVISDEERSLILNKERALEKLVVIIKNALFIQKARKKTKPKKSSIENRLKEKHQQALKKLSRRGGIDF